MTETIQRIESPSIATIDNEKLKIESRRCKNSFAYFLRNYVITKDTQGGRGLQRMPDWDYIYQIADAIQNHKQNIILKSRQMMISWIFAAYALWKCLYYPGSEVGILSENSDKAQEVGERAELIYEYLPDWMKLPVHTNKNRGEYSFPDNKSKFVYKAATEHSGRSFSWSDIFFDEGAFFPYPTSIMSAIGPLLEEHVTFNMVSTPNGSDPLFAEIWNNTKEYPNINRITLHWSDRPDRDQAWRDELPKRPGMTPDKIAREYEHSFETPAGRPVYVWNARQAERCFNRYNANKLLIRGFDRGYDDPACLWLQENDDNQLMGLHELQGEHVPRDLWLEHLAKMTKALFPKHKGGFLDYGASDFFKPESDGKSWQTAMESFNINLRVAEKDDIERRLTAVRNRIGLRDDGRFGIIVDPDHCPKLVASLGGGYHYPDKPDFQGHLKPFKDMHSHLADCIAHVCDNHYGKHKRHKRTQRVRRKINPKTGLPERVG